MIKTIDSQKAVNKFTAELKILIEKYGVEFVSSDHYTGYAECGEDVRIVAEFKDWKLGDIDFGQCINEKSFEIEK